MKTGELCVGEIGAVPITTEGGEGGWRIVLHTYMLSVHVLECTVVEVLE